MRSPRVSRHAKAIATATLGGDADRAARILSDLDQGGCVRTDTMGWQGGWMTPKGRAVITAWSEV